MSNPKHHRLPVPSITFALIDYDNVITTASERSALDVQINLAALINEVVLFTSARLPQTNELVVRIYGGWLSKTNQYTTRATWLLSEIPAFRRRFGRIRVLPSLTESILAEPSISFSGAFRRNSNAVQQKMVDGMMIVDLIDLNSQNNTNIVLISDDDDFVPALVFCARRRESKSPIFLKRASNPQTPRINDHHLIALNIQIGR